MHTIKRFWMWACLCGILTGLLVSPAWAQARHQATTQRPALATGAAFDPDGRLWVVGVNAQGKLYTQSTPFPGPVRWTTANEIDTGSDLVSADGENRPKIAFGPKGWAVITYTQPLPTPYAGLIRMLRSEDAGLTFTRPFTVHDDRQPITHRFESVAFDGQGHLYTVWVDKRDHRPGVPYVGAALYKKVSTDGGRSFGPDQKLADHSCECCRIALATDANGRLHGVWRHVFGTQTRDHAFTDLQVQPGKLVRATHDQWQINACPHHGPGLARAWADDTSADGFHLVWFGVREGVAGVRYARLGRDGQPVAASVRLIPDPQAEHADVAAYGHTVVIAWRSYAQGQTTLKLWRSTDNGRHFDLITLDQQIGPNDHPRLAQSGARMAAVWRTPERTLVYDLQP